MEKIHFPVNSHGNSGIRALCRIKLLPVTHILVDRWMLTVKLVYKLSNMPDDLKCATNTSYMTPFTVKTNNIYGLGTSFAPSFFTHLSGMAN